MTLSEFKKKHIENGGMWFDKSHMRRSKIVGTLRKSKYIITNDTIPSYDYMKEISFFKIWCITDCAGIKILRSFDTIEEAECYIENN